MTWNWQRPDWPNFDWQASRLRLAEEQFLIGGGVFAGMLAHVSATDSAQLTIDTLAAEAVTTSAIEGEILDRASVQSSIRWRLGFGRDRRHVGATEQAIADVMVDLYRSFAEPLSDDTLFAWHRMLTANRRDLNDIGSYRHHEAAMQIVSGSIQAPKVHFEAPPSAAVPAEMSRFIAWFNRTGPDGATPLPPLTRAGIAHLWFVCIHPFEDGNGRIGRAIAEKVLSQGLKRPTLTSLAATMLIRRRGYYDALERANTENEVTGWLCWFAAVAIEAQRRSLATVHFLIDKTRLLDRLQGILNDRQQKALLRMLEAGPDSFEGGLSARNYIAITGAAPATATRDLADLVSKGALTRAGNGRYARYHVAIPLRPVPHLEIDALGRIIDAEM